MCIVDYSTFLLAYRLSPAADAAEFNEILFGLNLD